MWYMLKQLWLKNKVRKCNREIIMLTDERKVIKEKQQKLTKLSEEYNKLID